MGEGRRNARAVRSLSIPSDAVALSLEPLLPLRGPPASRVFALIALELVGHPEQCAVDDGAVVAGQIHDPSLDDEAAEFDQMPRALAALDLLGAHVMPRPRRLMQLHAARLRRIAARVVQFAAAGTEKNAAPP